MAELLAIGYIEHHPAAAARSLSRLNSSEITALLQELTPTLSASLLIHMTPSLAARCLQQLAIPTAAEIIIRMPSEAAINPLRLLDSATRTPLLRAMPRTVAVRLRFQLRYPETLIGSLLDADILTLSPELRVSDALRLIRQQRQAPDRQLYVVDERHKLKGMIYLGELLIERDRTPLNRLLQRVPITLNAMAALHTVIDLSVWNEFDSLPVLNRNGEFQGVLSRTAILEHEDTLQTTISEEQHFSTTRSALGDLFWLVTGIIIPHTTRSRYQRNSNEMSNPHE